MKWDEKLFFYCITHSTCISTHIVLGHKTAEKKIYIQYTCICSPEIIKYLKANIHIHISEERDYPRVGNFMYSKTFSTCELRQEAKCLKTLSPEKPSLIDSINFPMKVLLKTCIKQFTSWIIHFYSLLCSVCVFSLLFFCYFLKFVLFIFTYYFILFVYFLSLFVVIYSIYLFIFTY